MTYLLDLNLLVALFDRQHVNHEAAHDWFARKGIVSWATCPITENGFLRVISNPAYLTVMATPMEAMEHLERFCSSESHTFWPDQVSLLELLKADSQVTEKLSNAELEEKFDLEYHLKHVDTIFARVFG